jgi:hypothetical protein
MEIKFVSREDIVNSLLDKVSGGYELTQADKNLIEDMMNGK